MCAHCPAPAGYDEPADIVRGAVAGIRRLARRADRWLARADSLRRRRLGRLLCLLFLTVPGLIVTVLLAAEAAAEVQGTVLVICGAASLAPLLLVVSPADAARPRGKPLRPVSLVEGGCRCCDVRDELSVAVGLCVVCAEAGPLGTVESRDFAEDGVVAMEGLSFDQPLGACPRCGGEAVIVGAQAKCSHCAAPLAVDVALDAELRAAVEEQRAAERRVRGFVRQSERRSAERLDGLMAGASVAVGLAFATWALGLWLFG